MSTNETMMQYFEWYLPNDGLWWKRCAAKAENLAALGITQVWLPPAYKGTSQEDVGYGVYDMYDLGEFDQKGTVRTKYGTKEEYLEAIRAFHEAKINVFADIVLNHRMGGDELEEITAVTDNPENRWEQVGGKQKISVWSKFTFPGRHGTYSAFTWDHRHFTGTDWDEKAKEQGNIYRFTGKHWDQTDPEKGTFDYLMGMNVDMDNPTVVRETNSMPSSTSASPFTGNCCTISANRPVLRCPPWANTGAAISGVCCTTLTRWTMRWRSSTWRCTTTSSMPLRRAVTTICARFLITPLCASGP